MCSYEYEKTRTLTHVYVTVSQARLLPPRNTVGYTGLDCVAPSFSQGQWATRVSARVKRALNPLSPPVVTFSHPVALAEVRSEGAAPLNTPHLVARARCVLRTQWERLKTIWHTQSGRDRTDSNTYSGQVSEIFPLWQWQRGCSAISEMECCTAQSRLYSPLSLPLRRSHTFTTGTADLRPHGWAGPVDTGDSVLEAQQLLPTWNPNMHPSRWVVSLIGDFCGWNHASRKSCFPSLCTTSFIRFFCLLTILRS